MSPFELGIAAILLVFVLIAARMPVAFVMLVVGVGGYAYLISLDAALSIASSSIYNTFASYSLIVVPLFVWMGYIAYHAGISRRIYDATYKVVGRLPAGLALATIGASTAFGAICGSTTATAATMSAVAVPEMKRYRYDRSLATSVVASSAILGVMIPPSVIFIIYGIATGESIAKLFLAGIIPGVLLMGLFMLVTWIRAVRNPDLAPAGPEVDLKGKIRAVAKGGVEVVIIFIVVIGGLFLGYFTPTEAGGVGAAATLAVAIIRRQINWTGFKNSLRDTIRISAMIMFLVAAATVFGRFLAVTNIPTTMAVWAGDLPIHPVAVLAIILLIYLLLGCFIDALALILLTIPIFYPVAVHLGFDPIWFGVIIVLVVGMGVITPPVGANVYVVAGIVKDTPVVTIFRGVWPYLLSIILCIAILTLFPQLALFLPDLVQR
ncbi:TRAP dicarboxylate transporter, DctM subunit [Desulfonatronospira thiodismutans ASO3-1]|uniref:TRAP dicarboxylate transporter, DctM subunit n=1 Tax=Desulfonatronospira thiodismutans ASO3-1 TaxID=555779 RepID=D6SMT1_9BACT|nr:MULTISPECIES: TRAP transporter large permease [Desulfonatronospira]EFI35992.1 TRAP dicarboxylate transporter, DctM subunit [Desulfonatronospira thiodismutans ASO3-1]RQD75915.1 MAG: TRAP transporter large permease [Desulfonatronospira sp. MSAO_Bac3]